MIEIQSESSGQLLTITFTQQVTVQQAEKFANEFPLHLSRIQPGFQLFADMSTLEGMDVGCAPFIAKVMDHCNEKGVRKIIRVIPDPRKDIGLTIMSRFHYDRDVRILTFQNISDARNSLAARSE